MADEPLFDLVPMVDKLRRHSTLSEADQCMLLSLPFEQRTYRRRSYLIREGEKSACSFVVLSGYLYCHKQDRRGERQITSIHMKGDRACVHDDFLGSADFSIESLTDVVVARIKQEDLVRAANESSAIFDALWRDLLIDARIGREWLLNIGRRSAEERLAHMICEIAVRAQEAGLTVTPSFFWPFTQEQAGEAVSLTSVHVNRTMRKLRESNLAEVRGFSATVRDWRQLTRLADFHPEYLGPSANAAASALASSRPQQLTWIAAG